MRDEQGFADFAYARSRVLRRQAYLLTGSAERAARLAERALADTARRWDKLGGPVAAEEHARRVVAATAVRERSHGAVPAVALTPVGTALPPAGDDSGEAVWRALAGLPPRRRAVLVLRYDEGLDDIAVGARLGIPAAAATAEGEAGLGALRSLLRRRGAPEDLLPVVLADPARDVLDPAGPGASAPGGRAAAGAAVTATPAAAAAVAPATGGGSPVVAPANPAAAVDAPANRGGSRVVAGGPVIGGDWAAGGDPPAGPRTGSGSSRGRAGRARRRWLPAAAALVAVAGIGAAILVPLADDDPTTAAADQVPARTAAADGQLDWIARGPLAGDEDLLRSALRIWRAGVPAAQRPVEAAVLYAGAPDGTPTVLLQGTDAAGQAWTAQLTEDAGTPALRAAEPLGRAAPLLALRSGDRLRVLTPPGLAATGLLAAADGTLRPLALDTDGVSEPVAPAPAGLPLLLTTAGTVAGSGTLLPGRLSVVTGTVEMAAGDLDLGPAGEPTAAWYADGTLLARRLGGPVTLAAAGPARTTTVAVAGRARRLEVRGYEAVRGGTRYLATVVRVAGAATCLSTVELGPAGADPAKPPILVSRCRPSRASAGVLLVLAGAGIRTVLVRLPGAVKDRPGPLVTVTGTAGEGLVGLLRVPGLPAGAASAEARTASGRVVARFAVPADRGPRV